jgi:alkaline phosphatase D
VGTIAQRTTAGTTSEGLSVNWNERRFAKA